MEEFSEEQKKHYSDCWKQLHKRLSDYKNKEKVLKEKFPNISDEEIKNRIGRSSESPMCLSNPFWDLSNEEYEYKTKSFNESWDKAVKEYFEKEKLKLEIKQK